MVLSPSAEVLYKATDFWAPQHERTILWNDPALQIPWPHKDRAILSAKDLAGLTLEHAAVYEEWAAPKQQTAEALESYQNDEIAKWWPIIKAAGIRAE